MSTDDAKATAQAWIDEHLTQLTEWHTHIWELAEPAWREYRSQRWYVERLREEGFEVEDGSAGMPTAFSARWSNGDGPTLLGVNVPLALSSKLHSDRPDNLIRTILDGVSAPAGPQVGFMAGFRDALDDAQIAQLAHYMRARFAPRRPDWPGLDAAARRVRERR